MQPNHALALIGVMLIASSAAGLILVKERLPGEGMVWDLQTFQASFPVRSRSVSDSGSTPDGGESSTTLAVDDLNVTDVTLSVTWSDNQPRFRPAASVSISVRGPQGRSGSEEGSSGALMIDLGGFNTPPNETDVEAANINDATNETMERNPSTTNGTGEWTVTIGVTRGGFAGPFRQGSVDWEVTIEYGCYSLVLKAPAEEEEEGTEMMSASNTHWSGVSA